MAGSLDSREAQSRRVCAGSRQLLIARRLWEDTGDGAIGRYGDAGVIHDIIRLSRTSTSHTEIGGSCQRRTKHIAIVAILRTCSTRLSDLVGSRATIRQ